jgi:hypothetical protein
MSVAMRCHFTSTHFHLLRVAGGSGGKERTDEAIFLEMPENDRISGASQVYSS